MKLLSDELSKKYNYKKLSEKESCVARSIYASALPEFLKRSDQPLYTVNGTKICDEFDRIVIGDYGAYIEFSSEQANKNLFLIAPGQEYRIDNLRYANVKYAWLTINDDSQIKIYYQKNTVSYADYKVQKYYVSVYEVYPAVITQLYSEDDEEIVYSDPVEPWVPEIELDLDTNS